MIVSHEALLTAVHVQPVPAETLTAPLPAEDAIDWLVGEITGAQTAVNVNVFESVLSADPPGPTADTRAS